LGAGRCKRDNPLHGAAPKGLGDIGHRCRRFSFNGCRCNVSVSVSVEPGCVVWTYFLLNIMIRSSPVFSGKKYCTRID
jgi:hypothetical protein